MDLQDILYLLIILLFIILAIVTMIIMVIGPFAVIGYFLLEIIKAIVSLF